MKQLGPYAVEAELGRGGMGVVYRARDLRDGQLVAVKTLHPNTADAELLERFSLEAKALRRLRHPNLVRVLGYELKGPQPYAAFEFVAGETLKARVERDGPLSVREAVRVLSEVALGLNAAHERNLLHRDIKPANVLLGPEGAKLADFGLVKRLDRKSLTASNTILGTASYMAPEQVQGDKDHLGPSTDVYGMAATLYFALTGAPPFKRATMHATLMAVLADPPRSASELRPDLPPWLNRVCARGMAKANRERYPSAVAFRATLQEGARSAKPRLPWLAIPITALAIGAGVAASALTTDQATPPPPASPVPPPPSPPAEELPPTPAEPEQLDQETQRELTARIPKVSRDALRGRERVKAFVAELDRVLHAARRRPAAQRAFVLEATWAAAVKAAGKVGSKRYAELGGPELHSWFTARLSDPEFSPTPEQIRAYLLRLDDARVANVKHAELAVWGRMGLELASEGNAETKLLLNLARLSLLWKPELVHPLLEQIEGRKLEPGERDALNKIQASARFVKPR